MTISQSLFGRKRQTSPSSKAPANRQARPCLAESLEPRLLLSHYVFPADAGTVNVANFGAIANDGLDDTAAIQAAIVYALQNTPSRYAAPTIVYIPTGTFNISDSLLGRVAPDTWSDGWLAGMVVMGESREGTILQLADNASGFGSASTPKPMIKTGSEGRSDNEPGGGNQAFRHGVYNLTLNVGAGNPGAVGLDFLTNNRGAVEEVTIIGSSTSGYCGIQMDRDWPGPGMIQDVEIQGFDYGVRMASHYQYSMTFENLTLKNQDVMGIYTDQNVLHIHNLTSINSVPVIKVNGGSGMVTLVDAVFSGGASGNAAIINNGGLFVRNLTSSGYGVTIDNNNGGSADISGGVNPVTVTEFSSHPRQYVFESPTTSLALPIEATPTYNTTDLNKWKSVTSEGATKNNSGDDDLAAIQAAIDNAAAQGKEVIYLPNGQYHVSGTIILRGSVKKIIGLSASINPTSAFNSANPIIRFDGGTSDTVILEHLRIGGFIEHNSDKTLVLRHGDITGYRNTAGGVGDMFFEDVIVGAQKQLKVLYPQSVWARQLNMEFGSTSLVENNGGTMWILGFKTEGEMTALTNNGGSVELLGSYFYPLNTPASTTPLIINNEGSFSGSFVISGDKYTKIVVETRDSVTRTLYRKNTTVSGDDKALGFWRYVPLYTGVEQLAAPTAPTSLTAVAASTSQINLAWTDTSSTESGFRIERKTGSGGTWAQIDSVGSNVVSYSDSALSPGTTYYYRIRAYNAAGDSAYCAEANATTQPLATDVEIAKYTFDGSTLASSDTDANTTAGSFTDGPGLAGGTAFYSGNSRGVNKTVLGTSAGYLSFANAVAGEEYFCFTVTAASGYAMDLTSLSLWAERAGSSPDSTSVTGSGDNYAAVVLTNNTDGGTTTADLSGNASYQGLTSATFRIYTFGNNCGGTDTARYRRYDNVIVKAVVYQTQAPEEVTLAKYDFANSSLASMDTDTHSTAGSFIDGPGLTGGTSFNNGARAVNRTVLGTAVGFLSAEDAKAGNEYFEFTVTAGTGKTLDLTSLSFYIGRAGSSPDRVSIQSSADGYTSWVRKDAAANASYTLDLSAPLYEGLSSITFRFYIHGNNCGGTDTTRMAWLDNVELKGYVI